MAQPEFLAQLTPSSETLTADQAQLVAPFFTNIDRSVVALKNLPEVIKGALFSRYSRTAKGVRHLFLDEFFGQPALGIEQIAPNANPTQTEIRAGAAKAESFYRRVLSDYGDDSVGELGGAHLACQDISQIAARAIENSRVGISYLEKSSRYVAFDDKVNGQYRYYRPRRIMEAPFAADYVTTLDALFDAYAHHLPRMIAHVTERTPIDTLEFENALTGEVVRYATIHDDDLRASAAFAYKQAVRSRARDMLRCFLPMATLTNVGVWGNGRALEYLLIKLYADPLEENQLIARAAQYELGEVIGPFLKRADDEKGQAYQTFLQDQRLRQIELAREYLPHHARATDAKVVLVDYNADAVERVVAAILFPGTALPKTEIVEHVREMTDAEKTRIIQTYVGARQNRRHKPGRAFEHAQYEFDLQLNIGEYRDLQRHRVVSAERQMFTTALGYEINDDLNAVAEIRADYARCMEQAALFHDRLAVAMPFEAQYVVPFGFRVRYNVRLNLREAYHWIELRSAPQGHPDYRNTSQQMFRALQAVHPVLVQAMTFVDLTPDVPLGRLRAEMRRARQTN